MPVAQHAVFTSNQRTEFSREFNHLVRPKYSEAPPFPQILSRIYQRFTLRPSSDMPCHQNPPVAKYRGWTSEAGGRESETREWTLCTQTRYTLVTPVTPSKIGCTPSVYRCCHTVTPYFSKFLYKAYGYSQRMSQFLCVSATPQRKKWGKLWAFLLFFVILQTEQQARKK